MTATEDRIPERKTVSAEELLRIVSERLAANPATAGCEFLGELKKRDESYPDGGNWTRSLALRGMPADPQRCAEVAADIIEQAAEEYNLSD